MERRGERDDAKRSEIGRQRFGATGAPMSRSRTCRSAAAPCRDVEHVGVGVEADDRCEQVREAQRDRSRSASDVEQAPGSVESELASQRLLESRRVGKPAAFVVRGGAREQGGIPLPLLRAVARVGRRWTRASL